MAEIDPDNLDFEMSPARSAKMLTSDQQRLSAKLAPTVIEAMKDYLCLGNDPRELAMMYMEQLDREELMGLMSDVLQAWVELEAEQRSSGEKAT